VTNAQNPSRAGSARSLFHCRDGARRHDTKAAGPTQGSHPQATPTDAASRCPARTPAPSATASSPTFTRTSSRSQFLDHTFGLRLGAQGDPQGETQNIAFNAADPLESFRNDFGVIPFNRSLPAPGTGVTNARQQINTIGSPTSTGSPSTATRRTGRTRAWRSRRRGRDAERHDEQHIGTVHPEHGTVRDRLSGTPRHAGCSARYAYLSDP
jgi:hypothetical protein